jgi:hypothetical protein
LFLTFSVQVSPPPLTVIVVVPVLPSEGTSATSKLPGGGVKLAVVIGPAPVVETMAGLLRSSVSVPAARISSIASGPVSAAPDVYPRVAAPAATLSALNVVYDSVFVASPMLSAIVALLPVAESDALARELAPYTLLPAVVVIEAVNAVPPTTCAFADAPF